MPIDITKPGKPSKFGRFWKRFLLRPSHSAGFRQAHMWLMRFKLLYSGGASEVSCWWKIMTARAKTTLWGPSFHGWNDATKKYCETYWCAEGKTWTDRYILPLNHFTNLTFARLQIHSQQGIDKRIQWYNKNEPVDIIWIKVRTSTVFHVFFRDWCHLSPLLSGLPTHLGHFRFRCASWNSTRPFLWAQGAYCRVLDLLSTGH